MGLNENIPTGRGKIPATTVGPRRSLMDEYRAVEDAVLAMRPCDTRAQLIDVLSSYHHDALSEAVKPDAC